MLYFKNIILFVSLMISVTAYSQISNVNAPKKVQVGKCSIGQGIHAELYYECNGIDTVYCFNFRNQQYTNIVDRQLICFSGNQKTADQFYSILKSVFEKENINNKDYRVDFTLGNERVSVFNSSLSESIFKI